MTGSQNKVLGIRLAPAGRAAVDAAAGEMGVTPAEAGRYVLAWVFQNPDRVRRAVLFAQDQEKLKKQAG